MVNVTAMMTSDNKVIHEILEVIGFVQFVDCCCIKTKLESSSTQIHLAKKLRT